MRFFCLSYSYCFYLLQVYSDVPFPLSYFGKCVSCPGCPVGHCGSAHSLVTRSVCEVGGSACSFIPSFSNWRLLFFVSLATGLSVLFLKDQLLVSFIFLCCFSYFLYWLHLELNRTEGFPENHVTAVTFGEGISVFRLISPCF